MNLAKENCAAGFIGTGVMGRSMAGHLLKAGYRLHVHNRTKTSADELVKNGAVWEESVKALASKCNVIFTILGFPQDVEQVYLGEGGIVENAGTGTVIVDMTTSAPALAARIHGEAKKRGIQALDAPVTGGDIGAREARLSIMAGGDREAFDAVLPLLETMGKTIVYHGKAGSGQHAKMANQMAIAGVMVGVCESLAYAEKAGLDPQKALQSIAGGSAGSWSMTNYAPRMLAGDFAPGFFVKHFIKDMRIASSSASELGLDVPGLNLVKSLYEKLAEKGGGDLGTHALFKLYRQG